MRRSWALRLRIVASAAMLAILFQKVHLSSLLPQWNARTFVLLAAGLVVTAVGIVLSALRWQTVLAAMGLRARIRTLLNHYLAGLFVGNFLPSTIGGDVLRVARQAADNGDRPSTFASVVLERLTGWLVLPVITLTALLINPGLRELGTATALAFGLSVSTLVLLMALLFAAAHPRVGGRLATSEGWQRFLGAVHLGIDRFRRRPAAVVNVLLVGFAYQLVVVLSAFLAARALGLSEVGPTAILAFMPAVAIAQVLPISLGGLGVREGAFVLFLHPLGVARGEAIALGLLFYGMNLAVSLLGAPSFAVGGKRRQPVAA
ncbi:MAG TPA: lysylphosphatidylglycerol synthase transmembrane domain-containing protein [Thermoleophilaceae bacterium]|nr:lysylphosphatidylglycerol synthase transmembrane domain-containing protein [Thermoleophilaceae bacterium]